MATFRETKGLWEARRRLPSGRRISRYAKTPEEAERLASIAAGSLPSLHDARTVRGFIRLNVWPKYARKEAATKEQGAWAINKFILPEIGEVPCEELEPWHCEHVLSRVRDGWSWNEEEGWEKGAPRSGWTVRSVRKHLYRVLRLMARQRLIPYNYLEEIDLDDTDENQAVLTANEVFSLWAETQNSPIGGAVFLCGLLGLRRGEALARTAEDVGETLLVRSQRVYERGKGAKDKTKLKTESSAREIALPKDMELILLESVKGRRYLCEADGMPMFPTSLRKMLLSALEESGLPPCSLQSLRATFMKTMDEIGAPRGVIRTVVGHGKETVTDGYVGLARDESVRHWLGKFLEHASTFHTPGVRPANVSSAGVQEAPV